MINKKSNRTYHSFRVQLNEELYLFLQNESKIRGIKITEIVRLIIKNYIKRKKNEEQKEQFSGYSPIIYKSRYVQKSD